MKSVNLINRILVFVLAGLGLIMSGASLWAFAGDNLSGRRFSAINRSLGGNAHAMPVGTEASLANPAQLYFSSIFELGGYFEEGIFDNRPTLAYGAYRQSGWPLGFYLGGNFPKNFSEIADEGDSASSTIYEALAGAGTAYRFEIGGYRLITGAYLKLHHMEVAGAKSTGVYLDTGLILPFRWQAADLTKRMGSDNFYFGLSITNIGFDRRLSGSTQDLPHPLAVSASLAYRLWESRQHRVFVIPGARTQLASSTENLQDASLGAEYRLMNMVYTRASVVTELDTLRANLGAGFEFNYRNLFQGKLGYTYLPSTFDLGDAHQFEALFRFTYGSKKEKISRQTSLSEELSSDLNRDILAVVRDGIRLYYLEHGSYPKALNDTIPHLKDKYGLEKIPAPPGGTYFYDNETGELKIFNASDLKYRDRLELKNGSVLVGNIVDDTGEVFVVEHQFGTLRLPKENIKVRSSNRFQTIDRIVVASIQDYILDYRNTYGKNPASLNELERHLKSIGVSSMPKPSRGSLSYDPVSGRVDIVSGQTGPKGAAAPPAKQQPKADTNDVFNLPGD